MTKTHHEKVPPYIYKISKKLRESQTEAEKLLWERLRNRLLNDLKFRRQHPLGRYIADFFCPEANLVIEIDGAVHDQDIHAEYDKIRDEELRSRGLILLRLKNDMILRDPEKAAKKILEVVLKSVTE